jgi:hypothetical protein
MRYESSTFTSLYLEEPYGCVYSNAQRAAGLLELLDGELRQGYALSGADFFVYAARIRILVMLQLMRNVPMNSHLDSICDAMVSPAAWFVVLPASDKIVAIAMAMTMARWHAAVPHS